MPHIDRRNQRKTATNPDKSLHNIRLADIGADDNVERMTVFEELNRGKKSGLKDLNSNVGVSNSQIDACIQQRAIEK